MKKKRIIIVIGILLVALITTCLYPYNRKITVKFVDEDKVIKEVKISRGEVISLTPLTKDGYVFSGWYNKEEKLGESAWFNKSVTLNARWELPPEMTITFDADGGEEIESKKVLCDKPLSLPKTTKKGYKFVSWVDESGNEVNNESKLPCEDITLKATWEEINLDGNYKSTNLEETLTELKLEKKYTNYNPSSDAITIYLFYGSGCIHCHHFLEFLSSIGDEYGKYFNLRAYEVWGDNNNLNLMNEVGDHLNRKANGVPYIVIGKEVFSGYGEASNDNIKKTIKELYDTKKEDRYDIFEELNK